MSNSPCSGYFQLYHVIHTPTSEKDGNRGGQVSPDFCDWGTAFIVLSDYSWYQLVDVREKTSWILPFR